jgi:hypothetical protein
MSSKKVNSKRRNIEKERDLSRKRNRNLKLERFESAVHSSVKGNDFSVIRVLELINKGIDIPNTTQKLSSH